MQIKTGRPCGDMGSPLNGSRPSILDLVLITYAGSIYPSAANEHSRCSDRRRLGVE